MQLASLSCCCYSHVSVLTPLPEGRKRVPYHGGPLWFETARHVDRAARCKTNASSAFVPLKRHTLRYRKGSEQSRKWSTARAVQEDESVSQEESSSSSPPPSTPVLDKKAAARAEIQRGQTTAIITGAISVLLGVGYLVLLQLLDTRGVNLIAPPPEAFDP